MPQNRHKTGFNGPAGAGKATRFKPGQSGNPGGRPKMKPWTAAIQERADLPVSKDDSRAALRAVVEKLFEMALAGDLAAIREIIDRSEGKAVQGIEIAGPSGDFIPVRLAPDVRRLRPKRDTPATRDGFVE